MKAVYRICLWFCEILAWNQNASSFACRYVMLSTYIKLNRMVFSLENLLFCSCWLICLTYERKPAVSIHKKCSLDICDVAAVVLLVYFPVFIFPCMLDDGHRRLHYIYHCITYIIARRMSVQCPTFTLLH